MKILLSIPILIAATGCIHAQTPTTVDWNTQIRNRPTLLSSFNGRTGAITLTTADITGTGLSYVSTFNGRNGAVTLTGADVTTAVNGTLNISAVGDALLTVSGNTTGNLLLTGNTKANCWNLKANATNNLVIGYAASCGGAYSLITEATLGPGTITTPGSVTASVFSSSATGLTTGFTNTGGHFAINGNGLGRFDGGLLVGNLNISSGGDITSPGRAFLSSLQLCSGPPICIFGNTYTFDGSGNLTFNSIQQIGTLYGFSSTGAMSALTSTTTSFMSSGGVVSSNDGFKTQGNYGLAQSSTQVLTIGGCMITVAGGLVVGAVGC